MTASDTTHQPRRDFEDLWDYDRPAETQSKFRDYLNERGDSISADVRLELQTQIARTHSLQREFDAAHRILDEVESALTDDTPVAGVRYLLERGRTLNCAGETEPARDLFARATRLAETHGWDGYAVDAAHMVAITHGANPDEALKWHRAALDLAEASPDPAARRWRGSLYNNLGWAHFTREQYDTAYECFERALRHREEEGTPSERRHARWCLARCKRSLGHYEEALAIQRELESETDQLGEPDGFVIEEIAECLRKLHREDEAEPYFRKAHELLARDPWLAEHEPARLRRLEKLGGG